MSMLVNYDEILKLENRFRANLINSLSGFKSANLIGTKSNNGLENLAIFNSVHHIGANPALIGFIQRPDSVERHTFENIIETKYFTINHINVSNFEQAHQTAARYKKNENEFEHCNINAEYVNDFYAPFAKQCEIKIALELADVIDIKLNNTKLVIGKIKFINYPNNIQHEDGSLDLNKASTVAISGLDTYYSTNKLAKLSYAKPHIKLNKIE